MREVGKENYYRANFEQADEIYHQILDEYKRQNNREEEINTLLFLGEIQRSARSFHRSLDWYEMAEELIDKDRPNYQFAKLLNRQAATYFELRKMRTSLALAQKSLRMAHSLSSAGELISSNNSIIGAIYRELGLLDSAKVCLLKALYNARKNEDRDEIITAKLNLAWLNLSANALDTAEFYANSVIAVCQKDRLRNRLHYAFALLSDINAARGDYKEALKLHHYQIKIRDSILSEETQQRFDELSTNNEMIFRKKEQELLAAKLKNQRYVVIFAVSIVLVIAVFLSVFVGRSRFYRRLSEDLDAQKKALDEKNEELEELNLLKNKLFSVLAHDIRNPLNSLKGSIELYENSMIDAETQKQLLGKIKRQLNNTQQLLGGIVTWAKTQLTGNVLNVQEFDTEEVLTAEIALAQEAASQKGITIDFDTTCKRNIKSDKEIISIIIRNLLSNAVKFTKNGGQIHVKCYQEDKQMILQVQDNGVGMSKSTVEKLFQLNNKHTAGTASEQGFGMGLMLCYDFAQKLGATIKVESEPGSGSTFIVAFPI
ncbi:hypothetical protein GC194_00860 [bacterium]|nr:hypothetical protein [bacterium]